LGVDPLPGRKLAFWPLTASESLRCPVHRFRSLTPSNRGVSVFSDASSQRVRMPSRVGVLPYGPDGVVGALPALDLPVRPDPRQLRMRTATLDVADRPLVTRPDRHTTASTGARQSVHHLSSGCRDQPPGPWRYRHHPPPPPTLAPMSGAPVTGPWLGGQRGHRSPDRTFREPSGAAG
jgi:hypothetical protein